MNKQFNEFAEIYDELFSKACNYGKEVEFYDKILKKHKCKKVLEVGCGCGHRGRYFKQKGYNYTGSDISDAMLKIARRKYSKIKFIKADARNLRIRGNFDAIIFLGKGSVYIKKDTDFLSMLTSMRQLIRKGLIIIDGYDAEFILENFKKSISWGMQTGKRTITRKAINVLISERPTLWDRKVSYIVKDYKIIKYDDRSILRAFSRYEIIKFFSDADIKKYEIVKKRDTIISIAYI